LKSSSGALLEALAQRHIVLVGGAGAELVPAVADVPENGRKAPLECALFATSPGKATERPIPLWCIIGKVAKMPSVLGNRSRGWAMKRNVICVLAATALLIAKPLSTAGAADMRLKAPPPAPALTWTGFYVGAHGGVGWSRGDVRADYLPTPTFGLFPTLATSSGSGALGGGQVGYNWMAAPNWLIGVEGDVSKTGIKSSLTVAPALFPSGLPNTAQPTSWTRDLQWLASARARIGYTPTPNMLLYVTGGAAWGKFDYNASFVNTAPGSNNWMAPFSKTDSGYVVGGGAEWMVAAHWMLRGEYLFYRLSGTSNLASNPVFTAFPIQFTWNSTNTSVVRVAASYKF
jgi:outer membrane immunogenic protein